jgi:hypothetical protein
MGGVVSKPTTHGEIAIHTPLRNTVPSSRRAWVVSDTASYRARNS